MKQLKSAAMILRRVDYGEADRIITFLTPDLGKVSAIAKGVRKPRSKLAGGVELFAESTVMFAQGKGELWLVMSTRLETFWGNILRDYDRVQFGYQAIRLVNKSTEDLAGAEFYVLLKKTFMYLDELSIDSQLTEIWFRLQLQNALGRMPSLEQDFAGNPLVADGHYIYHASEGGLAPSRFGELTGDHIKFLRLARDRSPAVLAQIQGADLLTKLCLEFCQALS